MGDRGLRSTVAQLRSEPIVGAGGEVSGMSTDSEVMQSLMDGALSHHRLEAALGDSERAASLRRTFLEASSAVAGEPVSFDGLPLRAASMDSASFYNKVVGTNAENVVGFVPLPVGIVGPLQLDGTPYHVPLATTEGALIASTNRGARAVSKSGGAVSVLLNDGMTRAPLVECVDLVQAAAMKAYCEDPAQLKKLQHIFSSTSRYGKLIDIRVAIAGRHAYPRFRCSTGDAMGSACYTSHMRRLASSLGVRRVQHQPWRARSLTKPLALLHVDGAIAKQTIATAPCGAPPHNCSLLAGDTHRDNLHRIADGSRGVVHDCGAQ